jgi:hypothetical protein
MSVFAVSKVRLDAAGWVAEVMWGVVDTKSNRWVSAEQRAPVGDVAGAIRNGDRVVALFPTPRGHVPGPVFAIVERDTGQQAIALESPGIAGRRVEDMTWL